MTMTLDRRIRNDLEAAIHSGGLAPGDRIPTERELMEKYRCARMTVSKAVSALCDQGLIERKKKAGSFVARPRVEAAVLEIPDIAAVIAARGERYRFDLLSRTFRQADTLAVDLGFRADDDLLWIEGLHSASDAPFAFERRVINLIATPDAAFVDFATEAPGSWLLRHIPWSEARHRISARRPDAVAAKALQLARTAPCLQVERWTWRQGQPITFVRQVFPGDIFDLVAEFTPK